MVLGVLQEICAGRVGRMLIHVLNLNCWWFISGSFPGLGPEDMTIWLGGHSFVKRVQKQENTRAQGARWALKSPELGFGGTLWREFLPASDRMLDREGCPGVQAIHLGETI